MPRRGVVALLTDFGTDDYYVSAMKGVVHDVDPELRVIDVSHGVRRWDVLHGSFILWQAIDWIPKGGAVVCVVDPGVGTDRPIIVVDTEDHYLVGPDNGVLGPASEKEGVSATYQVENEELFLERTGTFDGRDVMAPVGARLAAGADPKEVGSQTTEMEKVEFPRPEVTEDRVETQVLHVDHFGNVVTALDHDTFERWKEGQDRVTVRVEGGWYEAQSGLPYEDMGESLGLVKGSVLLLEISTRRGSTAELLGVEIGDALTLLK